MPLQRPADFGTDALGYRINDYCHHCFEHGRFTQPEVTLQEMSERCVQLLVAQGRMPEEAARQVMTEMLPGLKRWREPVAARDGRGFVGGDELC